jgi:low affinity Fe/Cu permease
MTAAFRRFAEGVAQIVGTPWPFFAAVTFLGLWAVSGPLFDFSTQWQLVVNSITTIITFLMVFIIQNSQNRDFKAMQLKLDVLLAASDDTHPGLINMHNLSDAELDRIEKALKQLRGRHDIETVVQSLQNGNGDSKKS